MPQPIRVVELTGTHPRAWGEQHGETMRDQIRALYEVRLRLTLQKTDLQTEQNVLRLAEAHVPVLAEYDAALADELAGIARASGLTPAHLVVVNHYTDLRDLRQKDVPDDPGGCSAIFLSSPAGDRVLAQTWDMHGSAEPFAILLKVPGAPDGGAPTPRVSPAGVPQGESTLLFTIAGCLGMTGLTSWGLGLTINNLNSVDATIGVLWPATVRKALRQRDARRARDAILDTNQGSGRHYITADARDAFGIESSGTKKKTIFDDAASPGRGPYLHTNHCVDDEMKGTCRIPDGSTTLQRYAKLVELAGRGLPTTAQGVFDALHDVALPHSRTDPDGVATCGAFAMDLRGKTAIACVGAPGPDADWTSFEM